jgi:hypothetical protein
MSTGRIRRRRGVKEEKEPIHQVEKNNSSEKNEARKGKEKDADSAEKGWRRRHECRQVQVNAFVKSCSLFRIRRWMMTAGSRTVIPVVGRRRTRSRL